MTDAQLELGFGHARSLASHSAGRRPAHPTRRWWFERMRQIVDLARDWEPAPPPRPEQTSFGPLYRQAAATSTPGAGSGAEREEQLVCE